MKQLCEEFQNKFGDIVICTLSPYSKSIHIVPSLDTAFFSQCEIIKITQFCLAHNLGFYFDCTNGRIVVYHSEISQLFGNLK